MESLGFVLYGSDVFELRAEPDGPVLPFKADGSVGPPEAWAEGRPYEPSAEDLDAFSASSK